MPVTIIYSLQVDRFGCAKESYEHFGFVYASGVAGGPDCW
jgi:hypothetical protein